MIDLPTGANFDDAARGAADVLAKLVPDSSDHIRDGFTRGTQLGATALGRGGALPHLRIPNIKRPEMVLVRCVDGLLIEHLDDFGEQHAPEEAVKAIFFLVSPEDNPGQHLRILAHIAGQLESEEFMDDWTDAHNDQEIKEALLRNERYVSLAVHSSLPTSVFISHRIDQLNLPTGALIAIVRRGSQTIVPRGSTTIQEGDRLTIIGDPKVIETLYENYHE